MNHPEPPMHADQTQSQEAENELTILDILETLAENIRLLVVGPLCIGLTALGITLLLPPIFTAETLVLPPQQQQSSAAAMLQSLGSLGGLAGAAGGLKNPNDQYIAMLKSRSVVDAMIGRFNLQDRWGEDYRQDTRMRLEKNTRITTGKDGLIAIAVDDESPQFSAELSNAYVEELVKLMGRLAISEAQQRRVFFEQKLKASQAELIKAEQALRATGLSPDLLKTKPESAVAGLAELEAKISAQEVKLASMRGYLADTAPDFRQAQNELVAMRQQQLKLGKTVIGSETKSDYIQRFRDFKYHETMVDLFVKQYEIARIDESRDGPLIQIIDIAQPPEKKSRPKRAFIALATTVGAFFVFMVFVFVRRAFNGVSRSYETEAQWQRIVRNISFR